MARDVKFLIGGDPKQAEAALKEVQRTGNTVCSALERDFEQLGVKSSIAFDNKRKAAQVAYDRIKSSGMATQEELARAEKALADRLVAIDTEQFGKREGLIQKFKANWLATTAAIGAAAAVLFKGFQMADEAAAGLQKRAAFSNLAASYGLNAKAIITELQRVSAGTIATQKLVEQAGTAMLLGIEAKFLPKMMEIARASSRITGQTITEAFGDLSLASARQSKMILDNLGIMVDVEKANKDYAASMKIVGRELTDAEKKQAFMNATLAAGQVIIDRVGVSTETQAEKLQRLQANMVNLRETVGRGLLGVMNLLMGVFQGTAGFALRLTGGINNVLAAMNNLLGRKDAAEKYRLEAEAAHAAGSDLYKKAVESMSTGFDLITGKIDGFAAMNAAFGRSTNEAAAAVEEQKKAMDAAEQSVSSYSRAISELGQQQIRFAESRFNEQMEEQAENFKAMGRAVEDIEAPLRNYLGILDQVHQARISAQKNVLDVLKEMGASQSALLGQQLVIATTEKTYFEDRLKGWSDYYGKLKSLHATAMEEMKKKQEELTNAKKFVEDIDKALAEKYRPAQQQSPYLDTLTKLDKADADLSKALALPSPERAKALQDLLTSLKDLPKEVAENGSVLISSEEIGARIMQIKEVAAKSYMELHQANADNAKLAVQSFSNSMQEAVLAMAPLEQKLLEIDARIAGLSRQIALTAEDQATPVISRIQQALDKLKDKTITVRINYVKGSGDSAGGQSSGTPKAVGDTYIPKDGLYPLHRGETVLQRGEAAERSKPVTITFSPTIYMQGGSRQQAQQSMRELSRQLTPEMRKLARERYA